MCNVGVDEGSAVDFASAGGTEDELSTVALGCAANDGCCSGVFFGGGTTESLLKRCCTVVRFNAIRAVTDVPTVSRDEHRTYNGRTVLRSIEWISHSNKDEIKVVVIWVPSEMILRHFGNLSLLARKVKDILEFRRARRARSRFT